MTLLVLASAPVGEGMSGTGIRAFELARALGGTLAAPGSGDVPYDVVRPTALAAALAEADAVLAQPQWPHLTRLLERSGARLIYDLYTPDPLEVLERPRPRGRALVSALTEDRFADALRTGHHFLCASEQQRDLWTGLMLGERLLRPRVYDRDPSLDSRIAVVPFGVPDAPPDFRGRGPREAFGLSADDEIVVWNGGVWPWLDPETAIRAVTELAVRRPSVKLVFMGGGEDALKALGGPVYFNDGWVPYEERAAWLGQAACAVSTHVSHLETRYAFRTRLLDCFWAGVPVVCTQGDDLSERIARAELGVTVPPSDVAALAAALETVLDRGRDAYAPALARAAREYRWSSVVEPIRSFLSSAVPPRLGGRSPGRPSHFARSAVMRAAVRGLRLTGRPWPHV